MKLRMKFLRSFRILFYCKFLFILILASWQAAETLQGCFVFFLIIINISSKLPVAKGGAADFGCSDYY